MKHDDTRYNTEYLLYLFPDIVIDNNTAMLERREGRLETLEEHIFHDKAKENVLHQDIYYMRRTLDKVLKIATQEKDSIRKGYDHLSKTEKKHFSMSTLTLKNTYASSSLRPWHCLTEVNTCLTCITAYSPPA